MDERIRICLCMIGGGALGSILGSVFGGLTAMMFTRSGHTAGTGWARRIADAFARTAEQEPSPLGRAVVIGVVDGFFFLGSLGLVVGSLLGISGRTSEELLVPVVVGSVVLVAGAVYLGAVAYALRCLAAEFLYSTVGGFIGSFLTLLLLGSGYGPVGIVPGMFFGLFLCRSVRRYAPTFHPPRVDQSVPSSHIDADTDTEIRQSRSCSHDDFFHKPDSFEVR